MNTMRRIGNAWVNLDLVEAIVPDKFSPEKHVVFSCGHIITAEISKDDLEKAFAPHGIMPPYGGFRRYDMSSGQEPPKLPKKQGTIPDQIYNLTEAEFSELKELDDLGYTRISKFPDTEDATASGTDEDGECVLVHTRNKFDALERVDGAAHYIPELVMRYEAKL